MPSPDRTFRGDNLTVARDFARLTRDDLGEAVDVGARFVGAVERGEKQPGSLLVAAFGEVLEVAPTFFYKPLTDAFRDAECAFRRRASTPAAIRRRALAHGTLHARLVAYLDEAVQLPPHDLPTFCVTNQAEIERAAETCRMRWGLGLDTPIVNMIRVLEHAGVAVATMNAGSQKVDAFSRPGGTRDLVVLNIEKICGSRTRYDGAHELGHLVLHRGRQTGTKLTEAEADAFASAFLLPRAGICREFPRSPTIEWPALLKLKERWRVSLAALVRRAYDLTLISAVAYRRAYKRMSWEGWRRKEPLEFAPERPELVALALEALKGQGVGALKIAGDLDWTASLLAKVTGREMNPPAVTTSTPGVVLPLRARAATGG